ncbi:MAG: TetR/AcrR family transcriptional regulator [Nocardioidaceae bacterium]|nr:TetR/AcrR family transcriptional regulator [Nocardioidaceae bacterium]
MQGPRQRDPAAGGDEDVGRGDQDCPGGPQLPVLGQPTRERADAARNRRVLLTAARAIMTECGVADVTMDRVAARAGVGVGTVYRRFGDRSGLGYALLDDAERRFQASFLSGPPPLGPGAPPADRIRAFLHAYVDRLESQADLHAIAEFHAPTARYSAPYQVHRAHLEGLLTQARPIGRTTDESYLADVLLAALGAGLFTHQRRDRHFGTDRIKNGLDRLLDDLIQADAGNCR